MHNHKEQAAIHQNLCQLYSEENPATGPAGSGRTNLETTRGQNTRVDLCLRCWARKGYGAQSVGHIPRVGRRWQDQEHR